MSTLTIDLYEYADLKIIHGVVVESSTGGATTEALLHDEHDILIYIQLSTNAPFSIAKHVLVS